MIKHKNNTVIGIPWYRPENYNQLRKMFIDGNILHDTYAEWLASVEQFEKRLKDKGMSVVHAYIEPNTFPAWCLAKGMKLDAKARSTFASEAAFLSYSKIDHELEI